MLTETKYTRDSLAHLPVAGDGGLRSLIRQAVNAGRISGLSGTQIVTMGKEDCLALLCGDNSPAAKPQPAQRSFALVDAVQPAASSEDDPAALMRRAIEALGAKGGLDETKVRALAHAEAVSAMNNGAFPVERVKAIVEEALRNAPANKLEVTINGAKHEVEGARHYQLSQLLAWLAAGVPVWAWGGAGAGKTHLARQLAKALGVSATVVSIDPTTTVGKLTGFLNLAVGAFVEGMLYAPYKNGGLVMLDEIDTGDAGIIASLNALLANDAYTFANGETVPRHEKFFVLAGANTKGTGATGWYKARTQLDGATLDRFAVIELCYDNGLELELCTGERSTTPCWQGADYSSERKADLCKVWTKWVQAVRAAVAGSLLVSPRASLNGCKALRAGIPLAEVAEALVFKLATAETRAAIIARVGDPARL